jgi:plastocyanin
MEKTESRITLVKIVSDGEICYAFPEVASLASGDFIKFKNEGKGKVTILFAEDSPTSESAVTLDDSESNSAAEVQFTVNEKTVFAYDVYNHESDVTAASSMRPIIIVYPDMD